MPRRARLSLPGIPLHIIQRFQAEIEAALCRRAKRGAPGKNDRGQRFTRREAWGL